jgi:UDP-N-acetylmuramoyl-L-alanyl-D-glutamate--2,6-diaminopimelate ligase
VVNIDDPHGAELAAQPWIKARIVTFGTDPRADVRAEDISLSSGGSVFTLASGAGRADIRLRLIGRYNISNALAAAASALALGCDFELLASVLNETGSVRGRLEEVANSCGIKVFVDYAHTDDALSKVLSALREITEKRLITVFGCGGDRDRSKRPAMGRVAEQMSDVVIVTSDNPRSEAPEDIIKEIMGGITRSRDVFSITDRREAIHRAVELAEPGDTLLIAGKGHEAFQECAGRTFAFDDRLVAGEVLK